MDIYNYCAVMADLPSLSVGLGEPLESLSSLLVLSEDLSSEISLWETRMSTTWLFSFLIGTMSSRHLKQSPEKDKSALIKIAMFARN